MPPRNRKKNKGKERKAKKVEAERVRLRWMWWGLATGEKEICGKNIVCNHGCDILSNELSDHPVSRFMDEYIIHWNQGGMATVEMIAPTIKTHPQIWNDKSLRENTVSILTRMGANLFLSMSKHRPPLSPNEERRIINGVLHLARTIGVLKHYDCNFNDHRVPDLDSKMRDLQSNISSNMRDCLKFFSKRVSCTCLKRMHQEARRTQPKMGRCMNCEEEMKRVALSVCSRCMITQYCSRECQVAHWPDHKESCNRYVNSKKQIEWGT